MRTIKARRARKNITSQNERQSALRTGERGLMLQEVEAHRSLLKECGKFCQNPLLSDHPPIEPCSEIRRAFLESPIL